MLSFRFVIVLFFFFFNDTATTEIYTLSLHDALPILTLLCERPRIGPHRDAMQARIAELLGTEPSRIGVKATDRKSTRLNSSHANISYAVFCLKKKKNTHNLKTDLNTYTKIIYTEYDR